MGKSAQEVEFGFDPAQDLIGRGEEFEIAESDLGSLVGAANVGLRRGLGREMNGEELWNLEYISE